MEELEDVLIERLGLIERVKGLFREMYSSLPEKLKRGPAQSDLLSRLETAPTGLNRRIVTEALAEFGYKKVKIEGTLYYRLTPRSPLLHPSSAFESE